MANNIDVKNLLQAGIKVEGLRQASIAGNIANLDTPGYRRMAVKFEDALAKEMEKGKTNKFDNVEAELFRPENTSVNCNNNDVDLDVEVSEMVKNTLRHKTYTLLLKKKYAQIRSAINTTA